MSGGGIEHIQPPELFPSDRFGFSQVVTSPPGRLVFVSGQVACDENLQLVGGADLAAQAEQALANLGAALRAVGATPADLTSLRVYVVDYEPAHAGALAPVLARFLDGAPPPAQTLLGIKALAAPGLRIEIEAFAVVAA
jgi:enamine deaminase RidA (YjgF/YER057c/UK114 family)